MIRFALLFLIAATLVCANFRRHILEEVYAWKWVDYQYPDEATREEHLKNGLFVRNGTLPLGIERWGDKLFITVPRRKKGVPATLGYVNITDKSRSPLLIPYPDWQTNSFRSENEAPDTVHISSTYRIRADPCNRLWVIDTGLADTGTGNVQKITAPQILIYDLNTDKLIRNYFFKDEEYKSNSFLANIAVDVTSETCDDAFAYFPDLGGFGLLVYDYRMNTSWRVEHHYFYFDPLKGNYSIAGINFQWTDGAFGVSLSEVKNDGFRILYFHSLSSYEQFAVSTRYLRNETVSKSSFNQFQHLGSRGLNSQATGSYYHEKTCVMFYMEILNHAVTCWNTKNRVDGHVGIVAKDVHSREFLYPSDVRADQYDILWFISNNLPVYIYSEEDISQYNYFVFKVPIKEAIKGTLCDPNIAKIRYIWPSYRII